jgi:hypothetical protein
MSSVQGSFACRASCVSMGASSRLSTSSERKPFTLISSAGTAAGYTYRAALGIGLGALYTWRMELRSESLLEALGAAVRQHGRHSECQRYVGDWLAAQNGIGGLISREKANAWRFDALASAMYPDLAVEGVVCAACLTLWIAVVDDIVEEFPERVVELCDAHVSADARAATTSAPLVRAWTDVRGRLSQGAGAAFEQRIDAALGRLFDAYAWEAAVRKSGELPTLDELQRHRHASGGLPLYLLLLERGAGGPFAEHVWQAEWFAELNQLAGNLTCFANDILSAQWDRDIDNPINLTRVLGDNERALPYFLERFEALRALIDAARVHSATDPALDAYLDALPTLVTGVVAWMQETRRYANPAVHTA